MHIPPMISLHALRKILALGFVFAGLMLSARAADEATLIKVNPDTCVIVVAGKKTDLVDYAVQELQKHLKLVTGRDVAVVAKPAAGQFPFYVGLRPADDSTEFAPEEGRWRITPKGVWLYGRDQLSKGKKNKASSVLASALASENQTGTLFAVYEFLETALGIRWVEPGDAGIVYVSQPVLALREGRGVWVPQLVQRHMRQAYKDSMRESAQTRGDVPKAMQFTDAEFVERQRDESVWRRRMRMGKSADFTYGHAFTKWWEKYGPTHPEYFALGKNGERGPASLKNADRVKMCVSNPDLVKQVVKDHFEKNPNALVVNACENDSRGFCRCPQCMALDARLPGEENLDVEDLVLTDRYVHFTNEVLREARKYNPKALTVFYAYSRYNYPPRREKLDDGVILFLLPNLSMTDAEVDTYMQQWKAANAKVVYLRPNDLCQDTGLPIGFEEHMFAKFKAADKYLSLRGTDYDTCWGFWPVSGITNYIMARGFYRPDRSFEDWEKEYCATYGDAQEEMTAYYRYWRQIWNKRVEPNNAVIEKLTPGMKLLRNKMANLAGFMYNEGDFDQTDALLQAALKKKLNPQERARVETMVLANQHNRLTYRATKASAIASTASEEERKRTTQELYDFRVKHRLDLNMNWEQLFYLENLYSDNAGFNRLFGTESEKARKNRLAEEEPVKAIRTGKEQPLW